MAPVVEKRPASTPSCSALLVKVVADAMAELGVNLPLALRAADVRLESLNPSQRLPLGKYDDLWRFAIKHDPDPMFGIKVAARMRPELFDAIGYYIKLSPTLGESAQRLVHYSRAISDAFVCDLAINGDMAVFEFEPLMGLSSPIQSIDFALASTGIMGRIQSGVHDLTASEVRFAYARPAHAERLREAFGAPVVFGATTNALVFARRFLDLPSPHFDPALCDILERQARLWLNGAGTTDSLLNQVQEVIEQRLPDGSVGARDVAAVLAMSERTLRRRLSEVGASYQGVLDEVRFRLARRYLRTTTMDVAEIAYNLGFSDASGFTRAFKRWSGVTAMEFRRSSI